MLFLDPVKEESVELIKLAELFYKHKIPLRLLPLLFWSSTICNSYPVICLILPANRVLTFSLFPELDLCLLSTPKMRLMASQMQGLAFTGC